MIKTLQRFLTIGALAAVLTAAPTGAHASFDDRYIYSSTKAVSHMNAHPVAKASLYPLTVVLDTAILPFTVIAGFVTA